MEKMSEIYLWEGEDGESYSEVEASDDDGEEKITEDTLQDPLLEESDWVEVKDDERHPSPPSPSPPPPAPRFKLTARPGLTFRVKNKSDVLEYFELFFDDSLVDIIVTESNRRHDQRPSASQAKWTPIQKHEIMVFLTIEILQGLVKKPSTHLYWSTADIWNTPIFPKLMTRGRYLDIKTNLYFPNKETVDKSAHPSPKLWKVWPIYEELNKKHSRLRAPQRDVAADKSQQRKAKNPRGNKKQLDPQLPQVAADFKATSDDVHLRDHQQLQEYSISKKRILKYYHKLFCHYVDLCIHNAHALYRKGAGEVARLEFSTRLVERLIETYHSDTELHRFTKPKAATLLRLTERHFPSFVPATPRKLAATRRCVVCSSKLNGKGKRTRKETRYMCEKCNVGLCAAPCFEIYHTERNF